MIRLVTRGRLTQNYAKGLLAAPEDREPAVKKLIEGAGAKLINFYFTTGDSDFMLVTEADDAESVIAAMLAAAAAGTIRHIHCESLDRRGVQSSRGEGIQSSEGVQSPRQALMLPEKGVAYWLRPSATAFAAEGRAAARFGRDPARLVGSEGVSGEGEFTDGKRTARILLESPRRPHRRAQADARPPTQGGEPIGWPPVRFGSVWSHLCGPPAGHRFGGLECT